MRHTRLLTSVIVIGSIAFGSAAIAQFAPQLPPGCSKEVSAGLTKGKSFHGAKCNNATCQCSAFECKEKGKTVYKQAKCVAAPT